MAEVILDHKMGTLRTTCHPKRIRNVPQPYPDDAPAACKKGTCSHKWEARWRTIDGGQPKRVFDDKTAGLKHLTTEYNKKVAGDGRSSKPKTVDGKVPLLKDYVTEFVNDKMVRSASNKRPIKEQSRDHYMYILKKHCFPRMGNVPINRIKEGHILKMVAELEAVDPKTGKQKVYASTIKSIVHYILKPCFAKAIKAGYLKEQPCASAAVEDAPDADRYLPTSGEVHAIAHQIRPFFRAAIYLMAGCGLREAEVLAFTKDCIQGDRIFISRQWRGGKYGFTNLKYDRKKKGRWIPLDPIVLAELERHIEEYGIADGQPLFYSSDDPTKRTPYGSNVLESALRMACAILGLTDKRIRPHNLRHYFASCAVARGVEIAEVSRMLGHKNIQTTYEIYYQLPKDLDRIKLAINGFLSQEIPDNVVLLGAHAIAKEDNAAEINELVARLKALSGMDVILQPYELAA
ncbi:site-specific integrase [Nonomuraea roseoviolacea subsp. roseoviolacea]|uniref:tyrosine-type recombinase/integrase n=1 Tax=Nonomuraea roseoviolacea TaxID=103837 RepID=UPI0031DDD080